MRKTLIAANWKMYKTPAEATDFLNTFLPLLPEQLHAEIVVCPAMTCLPVAIEAASSTPVKIGAQTMHWLDCGAYTGETSPSMLTAIGCTHVILGHSERRQYFNETDETVNLKVKAAFQHKLVPIVCVGENLQQREASQTEEVLSRQVKAALKDIQAADAASLVVAYEPVWAIGTGRTATPQIAENAHKLIRSEIAEALGGEIARSTRILYGGSVKPENAGELCCLDDIDGALVGGASLDPASFASILRNSHRLE